MLSGKKAKFKTFFDYLVIPLEKTGVTPNQLTFISLLLVFAFFYLMVAGNYIAALAFLAASILLDALDGHLARLTKTSSIYGAYLDTIVDRYVEFIIYLSFLFINLPTIIFSPVIWIVLCIFGSLMTTYSKAAYVEKTKKDFSGGFLERAERMLLIIIGVALLSSNPIYLVYILIILAALTNISAIHRISKALKLCTRN
jgi:archaetidylinositol phosphate synthase